jgi:hypothetical protein
MSSLSDLGRDPSQSCRAVTCKGGQRLWTAEPAKAVTSLDHPRRLLGREAEPVDQDLDASQRQKCLRPS